MYLIIKIILLAWPGISSAHEAYVLPRPEFEAGLKYVSVQTLSALQDPANLRLFFIITIGVGLGLILSLWFSQTRIAAAAANKIERLKFLGQWIVRLAVSASFFFSATSNSFLGPDISLDSLPYRVAIKGALFVISAMVLFGFLTELAALLALVVFTIAANVYHWYLATYLNYLGELMVLIMFGARGFGSIDRWMFGETKRFLWLKKYESDIVRIFYGAALAFAAINVKFLHSTLTLTVVKSYHLTQFHWLFPSDPVLVTLGAAISELTIGLFIMFGFQLRLTVLISLFYITLSLLYFRELVWPHLLLYGISFNLLITPQQLSLDNWLARWFAVKYRHDR